MKTSPAILLLVLCMLARVHAGSLSLEAHESGTASSYDVNWETNWGSYDRDNLQAKKLQVTVHDLSRKTPRVEVEICFIAQTQAGNRHYVIYKKTVIPVELDGRIEASGYVVSPTITSNEQHYAALGQDYASGIKMAGLIVRGKAGLPSMSGLASPFHSMTQTSTPPPWAL